MSLYPDSYYSYRAFERLKALSWGKDSGWANDETTFIKNPFQISYLPYSFDDISKKYGTNVSELIRETGDYDTLNNIIYRSFFAKLG